MAAQKTATLVSALDLDAAREHAATQALSASDVGAVGLELELHLVDLAEPARRVSWPELQALVAGVPDLPFESSITAEPGGQLELSSPPQPNVIDAIAALQADQHILGAALRAAGFGLAAIGADPARPLRRITPAARYAAMEAHFDALGCGLPARQMMSSTAALQLNLNAGPPGSWGARTAHLHSLGPVLVAVSACSPLLAGSASGWRSMRQQAWLGIDPARTRAVPDTDDPAQAWASYALAAPVMLVRDPDGKGARACTDRVPFAEWAAGTGRPGDEAGPAQAPTTEDLDYHLSTLFPPVRMRGYLEVRYLDTVPDRWWPALATSVVTLADDPVAADEASELCARARDVAQRAGQDLWTVAARDGLTDPVLHAAALGCMEVAARRCPPELRRQVEAYADLVARGQTPGDLLRAAADANGPLAAFLAAADA